MLMAGQFNKNIDKGNSWKLTKCKINCPIVVLLDEMARFCYSLIYFFIGPFITRSVNSACPPKLIQWQKNY